MKNLNNERRNVSACVRPSVRAERLAFRKSPLRVFFSRVGLRIILLLSNLPVVYSHGVGRTVVNSTKIY